jgi:branched-chain amino acid transport system permease protein
LRRCSTSCSSRLKQYGGDDGLPSPRRSDFGLFDAGHATTLYYTALACCSSALAARDGGSCRRASAWCCAGCRVNERRMKALGFDAALQAGGLHAVGRAVRPRRLLLGNLTGFAAPAYMAWTLSGELIVMVDAGRHGHGLRAARRRAALLLIWRSSWPALTSTG